MINVAAIRMQQFGVHFYQASLTADAIDRLVRSPRARRLTSAKSSSGRLSSSSNITNNAVRRETCHRFLAP